MLLDAAVSHPVIANFAINSPLLSLVLPLSSALPGLRLEPTRRRSLHSDYLRRFATAGLVASGSTGVCGTTRRATVHTVATSYCLYRL
jgi:hypothetical protein